MGTDFFRPGHNCWTVDDASFAGAIIDPRDYYRAFVRAAMSADRQIFLAGWQFDTSVELIRGDEAADFPLPTAFLPFLNRLCDMKPRLNVYILAWDFSVVFGMDREWLQTRMFSWQGHPRIHFVFDSKHPVGACQHQKLAIIDGYWAFTGGMDICNSRWDVPGHGAPGTRRNADGREYPPKHDVQVALEGPPARTLADWFVTQWKIATRRPIQRPVVVSKAGRPFAVTIEFGAGAVALSQTRGRTLLPPRRPITEIRHLLAGAVERAERSVYVENQYFTSRALCDALMRRMFDEKKGPLETAVLLPRDRAAMEFYSISGAETRLLRELGRVAAARGHRFGVFHPVNGRAIWVHSKLMIVDDTFVTIGSANFDNRSMGFDTEINASWAAEPGSALSAAIARLRGALLAEHVGRESLAGAFAEAGIIETLESVGFATGRLEAYAPPRMNRLVARFRSEQTILDPAVPTFEERIGMFMKDSPDSPVIRGWASLREWMSGRPRQARKRQRAAERLAEETTEKSGRKNS